MGNPSNGSYLPTTHTIATEQAAVANNLKQES